MDIEHLNKTQIILLALLVSFVTSIATGIVTVTLMEEAPLEVTRTINQVVEKTVETVVPGETKIIEKVKEVKVGATESELIVKAVDKNQISVVGLEGVDLAQTGLFVSASGKILTASGELLESETLSVVWPHGESLVDDEIGSTLAATVVELMPDYGMAVLELEVVEGSAEEVSPYTKLIADGDIPFIDVLKDAQSVALGEKVVALGQTPSSGAGISTGNVLGQSTATASSTKGVKTSLSDITAFRGGPVIDLRGDFVGLYQGSWESDTGVVVPRKAVAEALSNILSIGVDVDNVASVIDALDEDLDFIDTELNTQ